MTIWLEKLDRCSVFRINFALVMSIAVFCCMRAPNSCKHKILVSACTTVCCAMCTISISTLFHKIFFLLIASLAVSNLTNSIRCAIVCLSAYAVTHFLCIHRFERVRKKCTKKKRYISENQIARLRQQHERGKKTRID